MTVKEYEKRNIALEKSITNKIMDVVAAYAGATLKMEISNRVESHETTAQGGKFPRYSDRPTLSSGTTAIGKHVWRKYADSPAKRKKLDWVTIQTSKGNKHLFVVPGGYAEIREVSGKLNENKNYSFTGMMWKKFGVTESHRTRNGFKIRMAGMDPKTQAKIDANSQRDGINIIDASAKEEKELGEYIDRWLQDEIRKAGLQ